VLQELSHKGEIQLDDVGSEACIYIKQITKNGMYIEFSYIIFSRIYYTESAINIYGQKVLARE
jgi:hypothetical protein